ncbi:hypothetical protein [Tenacibaculum sp. IB213877]|uniref:hypothetical protein n=1 Tax=Tenacibaculum sp. IB213877 TaxID=3097351 RepID=UPI002A59E730|nr:hypothetical protein [Tenacibaculum sp. IB213877]MDY0781677.1 hypothetical protein [Tenacibaculum sp. IB213877]
MKKNIILIFIILNYLSSFSQKKIDLSKNYHPNSEYLTNYSFSSESELKYNKPKEFTEYLKAQGVPNPNIELENFNVISKSETGQKSKNVYPINISIIECSNNKYKNTNALGKNISGKIEINTVESNQLNAQEKKIFFNSLNKVFNIENTGKKLALNKTIESEILKKIPFADNLSVNLKVKTSYYFEKIENDIGYVKINIKYELGPIQKGLKIDLKNSDGNGFIEYDLKNEHIKNYTTEIFMNIIVKIEEMEIELKQKSIISQKIEKKK